MDRPSVLTFDDVLARYQDYVFNLAYRMFRSRAEAQDAAQETFLKIYLHLGRYDPTRDLKSWICTITLNVCRDVFRRRKSEHEAQGYDAALVSDDGRAAGRIESRLLAEAALKALPFEYRSVVVLFYLEDRPVKEIARILGIPQVLVKVRLHRARKKILEKFGNNE